MPIYEYKCKNCDKKFDVFLFTHKEKKITCPNCGSEDTERKISSFAAGSHSSYGSSSCRSTSGFS